MVGSVVRESFGELYLKNPPMSSAEIGKHNHGVSHIRKWRTVFGDLKRNPKVLTADWRKKRIAAGAIFRSDYTDPR